MPTYRIDLAYDGSGFHGFARQPGLRTVQGELEAALAKLAGPEQTVGAGRTDAGVHAHRQVVSFTTENEVDLARLRKGLDGILGPEVAVWAVGPVPEGWSARFSARWRSYRYRIDNGVAAHPLTRQFAWHVGDSLDVGAMERAASHFVGEHDFTSFCRRAPNKSNLRRVLEARWWAEEVTRWFAITSPSFCHQQVRSLVAFCVDAGRGRVDPDSVAAVLAARDRAAARGIAPPHGLSLWEVGYDDLALSVKR